MMGAATEKARLPKFSFVLGIESCCEVDNLSFKFQDAQAHLKKLTTSSVDAQLNAMSDHTWLRGSGDNPIYSDTYLVG